MRSLHDHFSYDPETGHFTRLKGAGAGKVVTSRYSNGYVRLRADGKSHLAHRIAWLFMTGSLPGKDIDHINLDRSDNRWANLRAATRSENLGNTGARSHNKSGIKGAYFSKRLRKWQSFIQRDGKHRYLGLFKTAQDAHDAYLVAAGEDFGEFARGAR